jgi:hypothetical protein
MRQYGERLTPIQEEINETQKNITIGSIFGRIESHNLPQTSI